MKTIFLFFFALFFVNNIYSSEFNIYYQKNGDIILKKMHNSLFEKINQNDISKHKNYYLNSKFVLVYNLKNEILFNMILNVELPFIVKRQDQ